MLMMPARPGFSFASLDSSLTFAAVSQPQKKKTPSANALARAEKLTEPGLNQFADREVVAC